MGVSRRVPGSRRISRRTRWISGATALVMAVSLFTVVAPTGLPGAPTAALATDPACTDSSLAATEYDYGRSGCRRR